MNVSNDPRFFAANVMDKRLSAFKVLTICSSLMFMTSIRMCFKLKKDMQLSDAEAWIGSLAMWEVLSFFLALFISIMCLLSLYITAHQLFYCYRLMTAGPSGFDSAAIFYLTRTVTMWRHLSMKFLFNGLLLFLCLVAMQLLGKFYEDADTVRENIDEVMVMNLRGGAAMPTTETSFAVHHKLNMRRHVLLGYLSLGICVAAAILMRHIRAAHLKVFQENYKFCTERTTYVTGVLRDMSHRAGAHIET